MIAGPWTGRGGDAPLGAAPGFSAGDGFSRQDLRWELLLIGYGNELRGDDAAGPRVARLIEHHRFAGVESVAAPLLLPEMAMDMAQSRRVLLVDASTRCSHGGVYWCQLGTTARWDALSCTISPETLLALCAALYGYRPEAWLVEVPGVRFDIGEELSGVALRGIDMAAWTIRSWIGGLSAQPFSAQATVGVSLGPKPQGNG